VTNLKTEKLTPYQTCSTHARIGAAFPKITFYTYSGHPRPQVQLKGTLKKTLPGTTAAPRQNPHTQPGLTSFPPHFPSHGYTRGIITQSKAVRLFQL